MLAVVGMGLTAAGTVMAITPPRLAEWTDEEMVRRNWWRRRLYYSGISLIVMGTGMQLIAAWMG